MLKKYKEYSKKLIKMGKDDQALRLKFAPNKGNPEIWEEIAKIDSVNQKQLKEIMTEIGLPTISKVGDKASLSAWLVAQHAINDIDFMKSYLTLMLENKNDVRKSNIALMQDRLLVKDGKKQIYGSQVQIDPLTGLWSALPLENPEDVDSLRKSMDLKPLKSYLDHFNKDLRA